VDVSIQAPGIRLGLSLALAARTDRLTADALSALAPATIIAALQPCAVGHAALAVHLAQRIVKRPFQREALAAGPTTTIRPAFLIYTVRRADISSGPITLVGAGEILVHALTEVVVLFDAAWDCSKQRRQAD